jgi:predicted Zn-dependent protease
MKNLRKHIFRFSLCLCLAGTSCDKNGNLNLLSVEDDKKLGLQVSQEIASKPGEYPLLDEAAYPGAYAYIRTLTDKILNSGKLAYRNEFAWQVKIIRDDATLNAFCTPGGYIYVYTGLIKYLDNEDQLAGVMGHEIAHADLRHTSRQMTRQYGYETMIQVITGKSPGTLAQIALGLKTLANSREFETEADGKSVEYLSTTSYACNGAAGFFEKMLANGNAPNQPQWLSTHPNPDNRVAAINQKADQVGCSKSPLNPATYNEFRSSLP